MLSVQEGTQASAMAVQTLQLLAVILVLSGNGNVYRDGSGGVCGAHGGSG